LNGTPLEDKCKIYKNICKLKCSFFTISENCRSDNCFWLYNETKGEEGSCKEKDDDNLRCDEVIRSGQCTQADIKAFDGKCWWNGEANGSGVCLSVEDEYTCERLSPFVCDSYEMILSSLVVSDEPCFYNSDKNTVDSKCEPISEVIECGDIHTNGLFEMEKHYCDDAKDIFSWIKGGGCMWVSEDDDGSDGKCVQVESCSDLMKIKNGSQCSSYSSLKGSCFFNGDVEINNSEVRCSDVVDVIRCKDILEMGVCVYAKKDTFPNLIIDSLSSPFSPYCMWENTNETCISKNSFKDELECDKFNIDVCDLFQGCAAVGGMILLTV
jgi:hypothetical protein